jgi:hypothetical protein
MIADALTNYARGLSKPDARRAATLGASDIGLCARKTYYLKRGGERDLSHVDGWGATLRGSVLERKFWLPALRARFGDNLKFAGHKQRRFRSGFLSATPDALLVDVPANILASLSVLDIGSDCLLLECKSIDPRVRLDGPKPEHCYQSQVQLGVVREVTKFKPRFAIISYTDASFWDLTIEFVVEFDPDIYASAKARAAKVLTASAASELPPEGWIAGGKECERCPFTRACGIERHTVPPSDADADPQFVAEIRDLAFAYKARQGEVDSATVKVRELQHEIRERLRAKNLRRVAVAGFSVIWSPVKGRQGLDIKALSAAATAAGIDISKFETVAEPGDRLDIRVREARSPCRIPQSDPLEFLKKFAAQAIKDSARERGRNRA